MPLSEFKTFLDQHPGPGIIDVTIDTTLRAGAVVPLMEVCIYAPNGGGVALAEAARMAYDNKDDGFFYDELELVDAADEVDVSMFYPRWPHDTDEGDVALMHALCEAIPKPCDAASRKTYLFHHVDRQPFINLLTGKPFALRG